MHTKVLIRTDSFIEHYQHWLKMNVNEVLEIMSGSYANEVFGKGSDDFDYKKNADTTVIKWKPSVLNKQEMGFLMDYFQTKLCQHGYTLSLSDERQELFDSGLRFTIHRHFLKPIITAVHQNNPCYNFGNLILEHQFNQKNNAFSMTVHRQASAELSSVEKLMEFILG